MRKLLFSVIAVLCLARAGFAQSTANYTFATTATGSLASTTGATQLLAANANGVASGLQSIGFDFYFMGNRFTQFSVNDDGVLQLGGTAVAAGATTGGNTVITTGTTSLPTFAAFTGNLKVGAAGVVRYVVNGAAPNRVLVVEYLNMNVFGTGTNNDASWQMQFYETTGVIQYAYQGMNVSAVADANRTPNIGFYTGSVTNAFMGVNYATNAVSTTSPYSANSTIAATGAVPNLNSPTGGNRRNYSFTPPVPTAPTNLTIANVGFSDTLKWADNSGNETGFAIYQSIDGGTTYSFVAKTATNTTTYIVTGLTLGVTYTFKVVAVSEGGVSAGVTGRITARCLDVMADHIPSSSFSDDDGKAVVNVSGGVAPYSYLWSNGATTSGITDLTPGYYSVTVTDVSGCIQKRQIYVTAAESIFATGTNSLSAFGNGNTVNSFIPKFPGATAASINIKWKTMTAGDRNVLAIRDDSTLWAWGYNVYGQLGIGNTTNTTTPGQVLSGKWLNVSSYNGTSIGIKSDGTLWTWGLNSNGQLGDSTTTNKSSPTVPNGTAGSKWIAVAEGMANSYAIRSDGTLWATGRNAEGSVGDSTTTQRTIFTQVGIASDWVYISAGEWIAFGIRADGTLWAWGNNNNHNLGDNSTTNRTAPVQIGIATNWLAATAGTKFGAGLRTDGTLWSWGGACTDGQLGLGSTTTVNIPTQVGTDTDWKMVTSGSAIIHAIKTDGGLWGWGDNSLGTIGDSTTVDRNVPTLSKVAGPWSFVEDGDYYTAYSLKPAVLPSPDITSTESSPTCTTPIPYTVTFPEPVSGFAQSDLVVTGGTITAASFVNVIPNRVWNFSITPTTTGSTTKAKIAVGAATASIYSDLPTGADSLSIAACIPIVTTYSVTPVTTVGGSDGAITLTISGGVSPYTYNWSNTTNTQNQIGISAGIYTVTITDASGGISKRIIEVPTMLNRWMTGNNSYGQLGNGSKTSKTNWTFYGPLTDKWVSLSAAYLNSLGIKGDGSLWGWGFGSAGTLGNGTRYTYYSPVRVGTANDWRKCVAGSRHCAAIRSDGSLYTWGINDNGQLGLGNYVNKYSPQLVGGTSKWIDVAIGSYHTIAVKADGSLWAWGYNGQGQLGAGNNTSVNAPVRIGGRLDWIAVAAGLASSYALRADGTLWACGYNVFGQLGIGNAAGKNAMVRVGTGQDWVAVTSSVDGYSVMAVKADGSLWSWGANYKGQLGIGTTANRSSPTRVGTANNWSRVFMAGEHSLAVTNSGSLYAWGSNANAQLGNGTTIQKNTATAASFALVPPSPNAWGSIAASLFSSIALAPPPGQPLPDIATLAGDTTTNSLIPVTIQFSEGVTGFTGSDLVITNGTIQPGSFTGSGTSYSFILIPTTFGSVKVALAANKSNGITSGFPNVVAEDLNIVYLEALKVYGQTSAVTTTGGTDGAVSLTVSGAVPPYTYSWYKTDGSTAGTTQSITNLAAGFYRVIVNDANGQQQTRVFEVTTQQPRWGWGYNAYGQLGNGGYTSKLNPSVIPPYTDRWTSLTASVAFSLGIKADGTLWGWGYNGLGGLGLGNYTSQVDPKQVGTDTWQQVSAGRDHTAAIKNDGTLWTWGYNQYGQLGLGNNKTKNTPQQVGTDKWIAVAAGRIHTAGIKADGTLWTWGYGGGGALGLGNYTNVLVPKQVGLDKNWISISVGELITVAMTADSTILTFGTNTIGELGDGTNITRNIPVPVGADNDWLMVRCGQNSTVGAIKTDGTYWAWGRNNVGTFGRGNTTSSNVPVQVGTATDWYKIRFGDYQGLGIKANGQLFSWGYNNNGQVGNGSYTQQNTATAVPFTLYAPSTNTWSDIAGGAAYSIGLAPAPPFPVVDISSSFGDTTVSKPIPVTITFSEAVTGFTQSDMIITNGTVIAGTFSGNGRVWTFMLDPVAYGPVTIDIAANMANSAVNSTGNYAAEQFRVFYLEGLKAWFNTTAVTTTGGTDGSIDLNVSGGTGPYTYSWSNGATSEDVSGLTAGLYTVNITDASGQTQVRDIEVTTAQNLWTWGWNADGQLANGSHTSKKTATFIGPAGNKYVQLSGTFRHFLIVKADGSLWAWGNNTYGQLGTGNATGQVSPVQIGAATDWRTTSAGRWHSAAIKKDGTLWTWGYNNYGQLGSGNNTNRSAPAQLGTDKWTAVATGANHTIAIRQDGTLWAWGDNDNGGLGIGNLTHKNVPVQVGSDAHWLAVTAGYNYSIALRSDSTLWAWGYNAYGQLGDGITTQHLEPTLILAGESWRSISAANDDHGHTLGVKKDGTLWAWGYNAQGQLGDGTTTQSLEPEQIDTATDYLTVAAGSLHSAARKGNPQTWTFGYGIYGQIGQGTATNATTPVEVIRPGGDVSNWSQIAMGNGNSAGLAPPPPYPVPDINSLEPDTTNSAGAYLITVKFSEPVTGFTAADLNITGASMVNGSFNGSGDTYTFNMLPGSTGLMTIDVAPNTSNSTITAQPNLVAEQYQLYYTTVPLPVHLVSFTAATGNNCSNILSWQTATESNSDKYVVEYSLDGKQFITIGEIISNNSPVGSTYRFMHANPAKGSVYYRLKMVDMDGSAAYSNVVSLKSDCGVSVIRLSPNPVKNVLTVQGLDGKNTLTLYNNFGQRIMEQHTNTATATINMSLMVPGIYLVNIVDEHGMVLATQSITKD